MSDVFKKKVCLVGAFAVGKTSLIRRFVSGIFSEEYLTTVGVKIDRKAVPTDRGEALLMIWDLAGRDDIAAVEKSHLAGAHGILYVIDGTRPATVGAMREEVAEIRAAQGDLPAVLMVNKCDLHEDWALSREDLTELEAQFPVFVTSALSGEKVEDAFSAITDLMLQ